MWTPLRFLLTFTLCYSEIFAEVEDNDLSEPVCNSLDKRGISWISDNGGLLTSPCNLIDSGNLDLGKNLSLSSTRT